MTDTIIHYDIRAVSGVTRAACGIDNRLDEYVPWQASNNRNVPTCKACLEKIDMLARFGGDAITSPQDVDNRRWFIDAVKEALDEDDEENDDKYAAFQQEQLAIALKRHDDQYFLSQRELIMEAVAETIHAGKFKFDDAQLRGQIHRVLNGRIRNDIKGALYDYSVTTAPSRAREMNSVITSVLNRKLAEAAYLVGKDFVESESVQNRLVSASNESLETFFEDQDVKDMLAELMKEAVEEAMRDNPVQFVQNVYGPEALSAEDVYRATQDVLDGMEEVRPFLNFNTLTHAELGDWAVANDCVRQWQYDTIMTRRLLSMLQEDGELEWPEAYIYEEAHRA